MAKIMIDPRIEILPIADGEVHIIFHWTKEDLANMARAFVLVCDGKIQDAKAVFRLRNKEGIDFMIQNLIEARLKLFGNQSEGK